MNKFFHIVVFLSICLPVQIAYAQNPGGFPVKIQKIKQLFDSDRLLENTLDKAKDFTEDHPYSKMNLDEKALTILRNLRNPFISQLPIPIVETPQIDLKPQTPTDVVLPSPTPSTDLASPNEQVPLITPYPNPILTISGLVWDSDRPQAIVNDEVVNIGDTIQEWTISKISKEGIQLTRQNQTVIIQP